ncbi:MAG: Txe/YoeB family addiction module toxin [Bacillota bacterium]
MYILEYHKKALSDIPKLKAAKLTDKARSLIEIISDNPFQNPPPYEKLIGNLDGYYSRRINIQHRLIYTVDEIAKKVKIMRMWTHYE